MTYPEQKSAFVRCLNAREASERSLGNSTLETHEEDTAVRAVSPPSMYLQRSILGTCSDASGEVLCSRHCLVV